MLNFVLAALLLGPATVAQAQDSVVAGVVLGATTARWCLQAGLVDEVLVHVAPVLLGDGVRFHAHPGGTNVKLERISLTESPQVTNIWLRVVSREPAHPLGRDR